MNTGTLINVWQGDYGYLLNFTLVDAQGNPFSLAGATSLTFIGQLVQITKVTFSGSMAVINAAAGTCSYTVGQGNFAYAGQYNGQIQIAFSGELVTFGGIAITSNTKIPF